MVEGGGFWAREAESEATNQRGWFHEDGFLNEFFANFTYYHYHSFCIICVPISVAQLAERQAEIMLHIEGSGFKSWQL